jgi:hypothetical protein
MRLAVFAAALLAAPIAASIATPALAAGETIHIPMQLHCDAGPLDKTFGKTKWQVFSCNDDATMTIVAAPGNPSAPFYYMFYPRGKGYQIRGEGTGRREATMAAFQEMVKLSPTDIAALIKQAQIAWAQQAGKKKAGI